MKRTYMMGLAPLLFVVVAACQSAPASTEAAALAPAPAVAVAEEAAPASEPAETAELAAAGSEIVCRSMKVTGTRFAKRECKTAAAWVEYDKYTNQNAKEATDKIQRLSTGSSMGGT
ncbi:MAG: hypothetical protein ABIH17_12085 [Pseudomonadota bacterium]|uniref:hypothetical protein n=1 Tax=Hyphomonas sp. BRH_c22 TaxID=1629710 RepID=UPI000AD02D5C|nr:hypothetical protein [Hyphomonas sp. BRH_c22]